MNDLGSDRSGRRAALATRIERFRGQMTDAEFTELVVDMARVADRFMEIDERPGATFPAVLPTDVLDFRSAGPPSPTQDPPTG